MWAHRSKTSEECRGCRRCDSVHPSIPQTGRDLFGRAKPGRAHNIPSGTSFALLMVPGRHRGGCWIHWKERSHLASSDRKFVRRSSNVMPFAPTRSHRSYRSYRSTKSMTPLSGRVLTPSWMGCQNRSSLPPSLPSPMWRAREMRHAKIKERSLVSPGAIGFAAIIAGYDGIDAHGDCILAQL